MNFKKYNEMELALLASIATMNEEMAENISMEKGDYAPVTMEDCTFTSFYLTKPDSTRRSLRRKNTFRKKEEQKNLARDLGYSMSTKDNSNKVRDLLSSNHSDNAYFKGYKAEKKHMTIKEETTLMERESIEIARDAMEKEHDAILGSIGQDIDTLNMDLKSIEYSIENLEEEYEELEEAMKLVSEKLENAKLRKNGVFAALLQKQYEYEKMCNKLLQEEHRFGW